MEDACNCSAEHKTTQNPLNKNEAQHVMSCHVQADSVMGTVKHSHTTQPGQPQYYQNCSSSNTEKASTQAVQLPQTYTTVAYQCYTLVVMQKPLCTCYTCPLHSDLVVLSFHQHHMHTRTAAFTQTGQLPHTFSGYNRTGDRHPTSHRMVL